MWTRQDSNLQLRACHSVLSIKLLALKNTSILTNRCSVLSKILINLLFNYSLIWNILQEHRTDSNHRRTGNIPTPSCHWKYDTLLYCCQLCALPHIWKPCLLTKILLSVSSRASNAPLRTTKYIVADCLLPHLLITGWLLTIYSTAWFIMCFLALGATSYLTQCENLRSDTIPDF